MSKTANANDGDGDPFAGSSRGPLDPVAVPSSWSAKGIALQAAATVSTLAYLKLRYDTTFVKNGDGSKQQQQQQASPAAALLLAAEALAAFRALCHLGPFNLRTREQYRDAEELLAANSFEGCHMVRVVYFFLLEEERKKRRGGGGEGRTRRLTKNEKKTQKKFSASSSPATPSRSTSSPPPPSPPRPPTCPPAWSAQSTSATTAPTP